MGISTFLQTVHRTELDALLTIHLDDDARLRAVLTTGIQRRREEEAGVTPIEAAPSPESVATPGQTHRNCAACCWPCAPRRTPPQAPLGSLPASTLLAAGSESLASAILDAPIEVPVLLLIPPPSSQRPPNGCTQLEIECTAVPAEGPAGAPGKAPAWLVVSSWTSDDELWPVDGRRPERLVEERVGPFSSQGAAWAALIALSDQWLSRGFLPFVEPEDMPASLPPLGELHRPRLHAGPCVLDLDKAESAVCYAACKALAAIGHPLYGPDENADLLGAFAADGLSSLVGRDVCYGPVRLIDPEGVALLSEALERVSDMAFEAAWTPGAEDWPLVLGGLLKEHLQRPEDLQYALHHWRGLRAFVKSAAERMRGLIVHHW